MCMCGKPVVNGEMGFVWNGEAPHIYPVNPPAVTDSETILYDEPGRCGGMDSHSHHYRVIKPRFGPSTLLVRHGGGDERYSFGYGDTIVKSLESMDSTARYWMLSAIYHMLKSVIRDARDNEAAYWRKAAAEKRIKTRKTKSGVKVRIEQVAA